MLGNIYMSFDDIIRTYNLCLTETRGEVKFYRDTVTNKEYQFVNGEFIKVIFRRATPLEDGIWSLNRAIEIAYEM